MNEQEKKLKRSLAGSASKLRDSMDDKQFFTSGQMARRFSNRANAITGRYDGKSRIQISIMWSPKADHIGFALDNSSVFLNPGHEYFNELKGKNKDEVTHKLMNEYAGFSEKRIRKAVGEWTLPLKREERYELLSGLFGHEMGHILYTNGNALTYWLSSFDSGQLWYPSGLAVTEDLRNRKTVLEKQIRKKANSQFRSFFMIYAKQLMNCVEDGYVEARIIKEYPGMLGYCVQKLRMFSTAAEISLEELYQERISGKRSSFDIILAAVLKYATTQTIYWGNVSHTASERVRFEEIRPLIDRILHTHTTIQRLDLINLILIRLADELIDQIQDDILKSEETNHINERLKTLLGSAVGESKGNGKAVCNRVPQEQEQDEEDIGGGSGNNISPKSDQPLSHTGSEKNNADEPYDENAQGESEEQKSDDPCDEQEDALRKEMSDLLNEVSYDLAAKMAEEARTRKLLKRIEKMKLDAKGNALSVKLNRPDPVAKDMYDLIAGPQRVIAKKMERSLLSKIHEKRNVSKVNGLYMGRKLEAGNIVKNDGRLFSRKRQPSDGVEMAVGVLIDESGSMKGDQYDSAKKMAILLYEFCHGLGYPITVYGHNARSGKVSLHSYIEFDSIDGMDLQRILTDNCGGCNRDGAALRYMAERLSERQEPIKVLIIISDGLPSSYNSRTEGIADVQEAITSIKKKGIVLITAGLGESRKQISEIYQDHFLDISDLEVLPITLVSMLKRYIEKVL